MEMRRILKEHRFCHGRQGNWISGVKSRHQRPGCWWKQSGEQFHQRALACSIGADNCCQSRCEGAGEVDERLFLILRIHVGYLVQRNRAEPAGCFWCSHGFMGKQSSLFTGKVFREKVEESRRIVKRFEQGTSLIDARAEHAHEPGETGKKNSEAGQTDLLSANQHKGCGKRQKETQHFDKGG